MAEYKDSFDLSFRQCVDLLIENPKTKALWVLPTLEEMRYFGEEFVKLFFKENDIKFESISPNRFRIGDSFLIIRGGWLYLQTQQVNVDFLYFYEQDRINPQVIDWCRRSLGGSRFQFEAQVGLEHAI